MTDRQKLVDLLIEHEGCVLTAYTDTVGKITIGVGRNLTDVGISHAEAVLLLDHDLDAVLEDCLTFAWFPPLDPVRQRAVCDLRFNVGATGFRMFRHFIAAMARKDYQQASLELQDSRWAAQVQRSRVNRLRSMIETGEE